MGSRVFFSGRQVPARSVSRHVQGVPHASRFPNRPFKRTQRHLMEIPRHKCPRHTGTHIARSNFGLVPVRARFPARQNPNAKRKSVPFVENDRLHPRRFHPARAQLEQRHRRKLAMGIADGDRPLARSAEHIVLRQSENLKPRQLGLRERPFQDDVFFGARTFAPKHQLDLPRSERKL